MFFAKIPRHTRQNAITEGDLECILTRNCKGTEQLQILFLIDKPGGDPCKYQKVNKQDHNSRKCKAFTSRNASDHVACLGKRKRGYELSDKARKLLSGKEGVAKISHRHDDVVGKTRYIGVVFCKERNNHSDRSKISKNILRSFLIRENRSDEVGVLSLGLQAIL